jgi:SAM-dependent methyltransferase
LKAIIEWKRVVKPNGYFLFILPNKEGTFDHKRPVTTIDHLIDDLNKNTEESDDTHFEEILKLHDLSRDPGGLSFEDFYKRTIKNYENRCVHHHVFNLSLLEEIAKYSKIKILHLTKFSKIHLVLIGENIK